MERPGWNPRNEWEPSRRSKRRRKLTIDEGGGLWRKEVHYCVDVGYGTTWTRTEDLGKQKRQKRKRSEMSDMPHLKIQRAQNEYMFELKGGKGPRRMNLVWKK